MIALTMPNIQYLVAIALEEVLKKQKAWIDIWRPRVDISSNYSQY